MVKGLCYCQSDSPGVFDFGDCCYLDLLRDVDQQAAKTPYSECATFVEFAVRIKDSTPSDVLH
jgi:hypothetical protein